MNPLTNVKNISKLNETELASGAIHKKSWHDMYKDSAWIFIGGLAYGLTEGDILAVFSQYGEIVNINLVRDKKTGKTKGFCFLCYSNQKSTILAVDNFNGIKLCNRTIRVDHVSNYKPPKEDDRDDEVTKVLKSEGCAPKSIQADKTDSKKKKSKKEKKEKKKKKKKNNSNHNSEDEVFPMQKVDVKKEKHDPGYDKYDTSVNKSSDKRKKDLEKLHESSRIHHKPYRSTTDTSNRYENYCSDEGRFRIKVKQERDTSQHRNYQDGSIHQAGSSKSHKRQRSTSLSDESSRHHQSDRQHQQKFRHLDRKISKSAKQSSASSSDEESSSQSSSDSEENQYSKRHSRKEQYETYEARKSYQEEKRRRLDRSKDSDYSSSKKRHSDEKYFENQSKNKYRNDYSDTSQRGSHSYKTKHSRR